MVFPAGGAPDPTQVDQGPPAIYTPEQFRAISRILSRSPYYVDDNCFCRVKVTCSVAGVAVTVFLRVSTPEGGIKALPIVVQASSNRTTVVSDTLIGAGLVHNVTAICSAGAPLVGQCYVQVQLMQASGSVATLLATLIGGAVTAFQGPGWPGSPIVPSTDIEPVLRNITGTNTAIGSPVNEVVPTGARWQLVSYHHTANDTISLSGATINLFLQTGGVNMAYFPQTNAFANLTAIDCYYQPTYPLLTGQNGALMAIPMSVGQILVAGDVITTNTRANGSFSNITYKVREWLEAA